MSRKLLAILIVAAFVGAVGCDAVRIRVQLTKGNKFYKAQNYEQAIGEYKKILAIDPNNYLGNYLVAMSNLALYHPGSTHPKDVQCSNDAMAAFEKLLTLKAPDADTSDKVRKYYLSLLDAAGRQDKESAFLEGEVQKNPNDVALINELAHYYLNKLDLGQKDNFAKTLAAFERIAQLSPKTKEYWYQVGFICWVRSYKGGSAVTDAERRELIPKGEAALDKALSIDPDYFEALSYQNLLHREMAKVYANENNLDEAQKEVQQADGLLKRAMEARKKQLAAQGKASGAPAAPTGGR